MNVNEWVVAAIPLLVAAYLAFRLITGLARVIGQLRKPRRYSGMAIGPRRSESRKAPENPERG